MKTINYDRAHVRMKKLLESSFHCGCLRIEDCERAIAGAL